MSMGSVTHGLFPDRTWIWITFSVAYLDWTPWDILLTLTARSLMLLLGKCPLLDVPVAFRFALRATEMFYRVFLAIAFPRASKLLQRATGLIRSTTLLSRNTLASPLDLLSVSPSPMVQMALVVASLQSSSARPAAPTKHSRS